MMGVIVISISYQKIEPSLICPESELSVYRRLKDSLPVGWATWHSLRNRTQGARFFADDFIVVNPALGRMMLEVKGGMGKKKYGVWLQYGQLPKVLQ